MKRTYTTQHTLSGDRRPEKKRLDNRENLMVMGSGEKLVFASDLAAPVDGALHTNQGRRGGGGVREA